MTKEELQQAAAGIFNAEKAMLVKFESLLSTFQKGIDELAADMPSNPSLNTPVVQMIVRMKGSVTSQFSYELNNLKLQYGLTSSNPAPTV